MKLINIMSPEAPEHEDILQRIVFAQVELFHALGMTTAQTFTAGQLAGRFLQIILNATEGLERENLHLGVELVSVIKAYAADGSCIGYSVDHSKEACMCPGCAHNMASSLVAISEQITATDAPEGEKPVLH